MATDQGKTSNLNGLQLVSDIENETGANFKKCLKDSGFKQIVDNFKRKKEDFFNTRELLIDYVNDNLL